MSMIKMTVRQCMDLRLWDKYCEWSGCDSWSINEGRIEYEDTIEFDSEFKKEETPEDIEERIVYGKEYCRKNDVYCIVEKVSFECHYDEYTRYIVSHRISGEDDVNFELYELEELDGILSMDDY